MRSGWPGTNYEQGNTTFRGWKIYLLNYLLSFINSWQVSTTEHAAFYYGLVTVPSPWEIHHHTGNNVRFSMRTVCGFFNVPQILYVPGLWDRAYCLSSLPKRTRKSNHWAFVHVVFPMKLKMWWLLLMEQRFYRLKWQSNCHSNQVWQCLSSNDSKEIWQKVYPILRLFGLLI